MLWSQAPLRSNLGKSDGRGRSDGGEFVADEDLSSSTISNEFPTHQEQFWPAECSMSQSDLLQPTWPTSAAFCPCQPSDCQSKRSGIRWSDLPFPCSYVSQSGSIDADKKAGALFWNVALAFGAVKESEACLYLNKSALSSSGTQASSSTELVAITSVSLQLPVPSPRFR